MVLFPVQAQFSAGDTRFFDVGQQVFQRSPAFSPSTSISNQTSYNFPKMATSTEHFEQLEMAARLVDVCQQRDFSSQSNDLKFLFGLNPTRLAENPTSSGLNDNDYPNLEALGLRDLRELVPVTPTRIQPLPQELLDQFARMEVSSAMGLFPEIGRAWVTVDSDLFVWNFELNSDLAYFDGVPNAILLVGLVKPKVSVFPSQTAPPFILCVVTPVEVLLFAITFTDADGRQVTQDFRRNQMNLLPDPLYRLPLDGAAINDIISTPNGRIFLCARDCCLYEIDYQPQSLLFGKSCKKINYSKGLIDFLVPSFIPFTFGKNEPLVQLLLDESRHILYTRSENGSVQAFDLGADGQQPASKVAALSAQEIQHSASRIAQTVEPSNFKPIVFISPITASESSCLNLVGITQSGVRLFFTCYYADPAVTTATPSGFIDKRPVTLQLVHVRLPPGFTAKSAVNKPQMVHYGFVKRDICAFISAVDEQTDEMMLVSSAQFGFQPFLMEAQFRTPIRGRTWQLVEMDQRGGASLDFFQSWYKKIGAGDSLPPTLVTQHLEMPRRLIALTVQGVHFFERLRPMDLLRLLLLEFAPDSYQLRSFFELHHPNQACIMCVALACSTSYQNTQVAEKAIRAFYAFGGEPTIVPVAIRGRLDQTAASQLTFPGRPMPMPFQQVPALPANPGDTNLTSALLDMPSSSLGAQYGAGNQEIKFSNRHNSLYGYFGRIIGPVWRGHLLEDKPAVSPAGKPVTQLVSTLSVAELQWIIDQIVCFAELLTKETIALKSIRNGGGDIAVTPTVALSSATTADAISAHSRRQGARKAQADALSIERQSLLRLVDLVQRCREVIGLWRILAEEQVHVVLSFLPKDLLETLKKAALRDLVVGGKDLCSDVITCIISTYLGDSAATDVVSERLKNACPSLFTSDDATAAKASELIQLARGIDDVQLKSKTVNEALTLYKRVANNIHLPTVCIQLEEVECYDGIVDLALCAAQKLDPQNVAVHYLKVRGGAATTPRADDDQSDFRQIFSARVCCYKCITNTLSHLLTALKSGQHPKLTPQLAQTWIDKMIKMIFESKDELCHYATFEWMTENDLEDQLLNVPSPYLESYLHQCVSTASPRDAIVYLNLLWRYYEKEKRFVEAAQLLVKLAERHSTDLPLNERIAYLTRAVVCAKADTSASAQQAELLREAEDKLEVAILQSHIVEALEQLRQPRDFVREAIVKLNAELMDVTKLYSEFAEEFNLPECKLEIVHCAGHYDPILVETLWKEIIDKELAMSVNESAPVRSKLLTKKLAVVAMPHIRSPRYFPAEFLRNYLLAKSNETGLEYDIIRQFIDKYLRLN